MQIPILHIVSILPFVIYGARNFMGADEEVSSKILGLVLFLALLFVAVYELYCY